MSDFADRPFAVGTLTGLRAFRVDSLGRLRAPQQDSIWKPGENVAECLARQTARLPFSPGTMRALGMSWPVDEPAEKKAPHRVGSMGCTCGFYAYTDGTNGYHKPDKSTVEAIVEGYGVCTVGTRGWRSEKARLVALVNPSAGRFWNFGSKFWIIWWIVVGSLNVRSFVQAIRHDQAWYAALALGFIVAMSVALLVNNIRLHIRARALESVRNFQELQQLYPEAKVYASRKQAMKAHPLTVPPKPDPETAEDFWTNTRLTA